MKPYGNHILYVDNTSHLCVLFFKHVNTAMVKKKIQTSSNGNKFMLFKYFSVNRF